MSTHRHSSASRAAEELLRQVEGLSSDDLQQIYGISIDEDGSVLDIVENRKYDSVADWAIVSVEQESAYDDFVTISKRGRYDDDGE